MTSSNEYVRIFDTTLRDGEQAPGFSMNTEEKLLMAHQLEILGVDAIEAGFPAASPDDFSAVQSIAREMKTVEVCGLARAMESDIGITWESIKEAKKPRIHTFIATSPIHMKYKLKKKPEQILTMAEKSVKFAKNFCPRVNFSPEDAGRSDKNFLVEIITTAIEAGADVINIPDTVGYNQPEEFAILMQFLIEKIPHHKEVIFSTHCHDDLGLAVANSLAGVSAGARQIECTINGIGERAGNAALEEIVMNLRTRKDFFGLKTNIQTEKLWGTSQMLQQITGRKVQLNKAIVGKNAFAHESGIHQDGMLKNPETYEIITPSMVGVQKTNIILGKHSGRSALLSRLKELGHEIIQPEEILRIFSDFKKLADQRKYITDEDLQLIVSCQVPNIPVIQNERWRLKSFKASSGESKPACKITIYDNHTQQKRTEHATGTGMVDAAYQCLNNIIQKDFELTEFVIESVTDGIDAQAVVCIRCTLPDGIDITGRSGDSDVVKAAILAYIDVMNTIHLRES